MHVDPERPLQVEAHSLGGLLIPPGLLGVRYYRHGLIIYQSLVYAQYLIIFFYFVEVLNT